MADSIKVSTQVLVDTAQKIRDINGTLDSKLLEINKKMNDLELSYRSDASTEIRANMNALKPRFEEYRAVIESYAKFLDRAAQSYETTEEVIKNNASQFKS